MPCGSASTGAKTLGISVVQTKVLISALATFVAALGGGFLAMNFGSTLPDFFNPAAGLVWLAILVTMGSRGIIAALIAGVTFFVMPGLFSTYVPSEFADIPIILFGLGAVGLAVHPEGVVTQTANNISRLVSRLRPAAPATRAARREAGGGRHGRACEPTDDPRAAR